jgi:arylsulfatase A-like enzyme
VLTLRHDGKGPLFVGAPIVRAHGAPQRPNVLFVLVDTLRADALVAMPNLVEYATKGARFTQAITAATWTRPSLVSLFGGDLPTRLGHSAEDMIPTERERRRFRALHDALLPRRFAALGYETRAIGNNFFLLAFPRIGLDLGLDEVTDVRAEVLDTPAIAAEAVRALEAPRDAPLFLYLHFDTPHWPYSPPPLALAKAKALSLPGTDPAKDPDVRRYLGDCAYADAALHDLFEALERTGHANDTLVVVVGDHGEIFDPVHSFDVEALGQPTLHHHGWSAYDELLRVPLVMVWPGHVAPRTIDVQTSLVDVAPTIAALTGLPSITLDSPTAGHSLADALAKPGAWPLAPRPALVEGQDVRALRDRGWLYLERRDGRLKRGAVRVDVKEELYDVIADPLQHRDRAREPDALDRLDAMRARFAELVPTLPDFAEPVVHLAVADAARPHRVEGELRSTGQLWVRGIEHGRATPTKNGLQLDLEAGGRVELVVDPPDAPLELRLREDGTPLDGSKILLGAEALPLLGDQRGDFVSIDSAHVGWLDAKRPPYLGEAGEVVLWRDPVAVPSTSRATQAADGEVATMMQRWGYAQPAGKKP